MEEGDVKKKRKVGVTSRPLVRKPMTTETREEINKMRVPGVPYLPPPPDPNMFKKGSYILIIILNIQCVLERAISLLENQVRFRSM